MVQVMDILKVANQNVLELGMSLIYSQEQQVPGSPFAIKQFRRVCCNVLNLQLDGTSNGHIESGKPKRIGTRYEPDL